MNFIQRISAVRDCYLKCDPGSSGSWFPTRSSSTYKHDIHLFQCWSKNRYRSSLTVKHISGSYFLYSRGEIYEWSFSWSTEVKWSSSWRFDDNKLYWFQKRDRSAFWKII